MNLQVHLVKLKLGSPILRAKTELRPYALKRPLMF
jgi:hypothetical protein